MSDRTCAVDGCGRPRRTRGFCGMHYQRWRTHGGTDGNPAKVNPSIPGCVAAVGETKVCSDCGVEKTLDKFAKASNARLGRHSHCKSCRGINRRRVYAADPAGHRERSIWNGVKFKYGLTRDQFDKMNADQGGVCAICGLPPTVQHKPGQTAPPRLAIDHDHLTGKVRGLLCVTCNLAIGYLRDNPSVVDNAAAYLREWS